MSELYLEYLGIANPKKVYRNLTPAQLTEHALRLGEGTLSLTGALVVKTGKYTGRSANDKFIVDTPAVHDEIAWGSVNRPIDKARYDAIKSKVVAYLQNREIFVFDGFAGADPKYTRRFRIVNELASQNLFIHQLLRRPEADQLNDFAPDYTIIAAPGFKCIPELDGTRSEAAILVNYEEKTVIICGSQYAGEIKKSVFSTMNYVMAKEMNVLPMHCSANMDPETREFDFEDGSLTENTRVGYPVEFISNAELTGVGGIPKVVIFLTADAFGVLPPIARLDQDAAMYHFVTGFTSKLAGTERGITEPVPTFSTLFGEPFMPMDPQVYANMLGEKLEKYGTKVYLVNTGWAGGSAASGAKRMKLKYTRAMVTAALNGSFDTVEFKHHDVFNVDYPTTCPNVPDEMLDARGMWADKAAYDEQANKLAQMFADNFAKKYPNMSKNIVEAGPKAK